MSPPSDRSAPGTSPASGRRTAPGSRAVPGGQPPAPTVQFVLVTYAKRGRMRFASHRDVGRAFERAVRQAGVPIARSAGFNPHPKISYASGTQTGVASEAEYLTLALTAAQDPERLRSALDTALPDGIDVIEVREDSGGTLNGRLMVSEWLVELPGISPEAAVAAAREFLASAEAHVERLTNKGVRRLDARGAVLTMDAGPRAGDDHSDKCAIIRMVVRHTEPAVRPEDILAALRQIAGLAPASSPAVTRVAQGVLGDDGLVGPGEPPAMAAHAGSPDRGPQTRAPQTHVLPAHVLPAQAPHAQAPHAQVPHDEAPGAPHQTPTRAPEEMNVP
jgi:radical SAM-linked protein